MKTPRKRLHFSLSLQDLENIVLAVVAVAGLTGSMFLVGRDQLGEGVIALLYLVPISWSTARWGQQAGITAAVIAALCFNFFFIPPYYTFYIGSLEGWLLLGIFLAVAIVVVGRIQASLKQAQAREHEAILMYDLSNDLATARTRELIAQVLAANVQEFYQAQLVQAVVEGGDAPVIASIPIQVPVQRKPDLVIPILSAKDLIGEVRIWKGNFTLPLEQDRLLRNLTNQSALALERSQLVKAGNGSS